MAFWSPAPGGCRKWSLGPKVNIGANICKYEVFLVASGESVSIVWCQDFRWSSHSCHIERLIHPRSGQLSRWEFPTNNQQWDSMCGAQRNLLFPSKPALICILLPMMVFHHWHSGIDKDAFQHTQGPMAARHLHATGLSWNSWLLKYAEWCIRSPRNVGNQWGGKAPIPTRLYRKSNDLHIYIYILCLHQCMNKVSLCKSIHPVERCSKLQLKLTGNYSCCWIYLAFYWYLSVSLSPSISLYVYSFTSFVVFSHYCFLYLCASFIHPFLPSFLLFSFLFYSVHLFLFFSLLFSYFVFLLLCLFIYSFIPFFFLSISHSLTLSLSQSINQSSKQANNLTLTIYLSIYLSIHLSIYLSIYQTIFHHGFTHRKMMDTKKVKAGILGLR